MLFITLTIFRDDRHGSACTHGANDDVVISGQVVGWLSLYVKGQLKV
jgi:hypothetical protein